MIRFPVVYKCKIIPKKVSLVSYKYINKCAKKKKTAAVKSKNFARVHLIASQIAGDLNYG